MRAGDAWLLNILEDLVTAVLNDGSQLKNLDIARSDERVVAFPGLFGPIYPMSFWD